MPKFKLQQTESKEVARATFDKESDYKVVKLKSDPTGKPRILHKIQADRLIANKKAELVKDASLELGDVEHLTETKVKKDK